ncbi:hypothetical protein MKW92_008254, partial [Papaver armeniacum]
MDISSSSSGFNKSRYEAYNRLQAAAVAFGEKSHIPEIIVIGGQSDGKSSLLEALLGFRFNVREVEMETCRPLILQMVHNDSAVEPRCRFQEEDSEEYGNPVSPASKIADIINTRTEALLNKTKTTVSSKPILSCTYILKCLLQGKKGEPENTPEEILSMVKSLASHPHRLLLFLQQSSEFTDMWEVDRYLGTSGYLGITKVWEVHWFWTFEGILRVEAELQNRYRDSVPATLTLLEQRCDEVTAYLARAESKIRVTSDVAYHRKSAMMHAASILINIFVSCYLLKGALIDGAADPCPEQRGKTRELTQK